MTSTAMILRGKSGVLDRRIVLGVDLGDAETSVSKVLLGRGDPVSLQLESEFTMPTVIGYDLNQTTAIGRAALELEDYDGIGVSAKKRPTGGIDNYYPVWELGKVAAFLRVLFDRVVLPGLGVSEDDVSLWVGCPSSWTEQDMEKYEELLAWQHFTDIHLVSESRAIALVIAELEGFEAAFETVLVVDVGSSTTDFTLISSLTPEELDLGMDFGVNLLDERLARQAAGLAGGELAAAVRGHTGFKILTALCRIWREMAVGRAVQYPFAGRTAQESVPPAGLRLRDLAVPVLESAEFVKLARREQAWWLRKFELLMKDAHQETGDVSRVVLFGGGVLMPAVPDVVRGVYGETVRPPRGDLTIVADGLARLGRWELRKSTLAQIIADILCSADFTSAASAIVDRHIARAADRFAPLRFGAALRIFAQMSKEDLLGRADLDQRKLGRPEAEALSASPEFADIESKELADAQAELEQYCNELLGTVFTEFGVNWTPISLDLGWPDILIDAAVSELANVISEIHAEKREMSASSQWLTDRGLEAIGPILARMVDKINWVSTNRFISELAVTLDPKEFFGERERAEVGRLVAAFVRAEAERLAAEQMKRVEPFPAR